MSAETKSSVRLDATPNGRLLLDQWVEGLAQVLESMTGQRPQARWETTSGTFREVAGAAPEVLWWEQPFQIGAGITVWVAAPRPAWEHAGNLTLQGAGLESVEPVEARKTWLEILGQSLSVMASAIGRILGREVNCDAGTESAPAADITEWDCVHLAFGELPLPPLLVTFSPRLAEALSAPPGSVETDTTTGREPAVITPPSRTMELLLDVDLPVSISFGRTQLALKNVLKLTTGSIVELNRGVNDPVEILVNRSLIARGEVVVVEGNYGVRIQEIVSRQDRLRSIR